MNAFHQVDREAAPGYAGNFQGQAFGFGQAIQARQHHLLDGIRERRQPAGMV